MSESDYEKILQYRITRKPLDACLVQITGWLATGAQGKAFICANPHSLITADADPEFEKCFEQADLVTPDGIGIVYASKILGGKIGQRVTGSDIFQGLSRTINERKDQPFSYFFLGSTDETLERIKQKLAIEYPAIIFAGSYSPPYKPEFSAADNQAMLAEINAAKPDVLWVGMTAPKQEKWIFRHKGMLDVKFIGAIGAVFDFYVGNVKRSHPFFLKFGLEWLPRLFQEPRRLWRRNFISNPLFLSKVLARRFGFRKP